VVSDRLNSCEFSYNETNMAHRHLIWLISVAAFGGPIARAELLPQRPDLSAAVPIATCKLQTVSVPQMRQYEQGAIGLYTVSRPADDPLTNYQRTPLGDWPAPAKADRNDPWLRLVLLSRKRPVVIDLAVFIDGKSFRESREAWIDDVISGAKSAKTQADEAPASGLDARENQGNKNSQTPGTNTAEEAS
jgi:hypothetical protein